MSSTNITQDANRIASTDSEGQIPGSSSHENITEQQPTLPGFRTQFNVKITTVQDSEERLPHSKSLSSLDDLAIRIREQFDNLDLGRAVRIQIDNPPTLENSKSLNELSERLKNLQNKQGTSPGTSNVAHTSIDIAVASGSGRTRNDSVCSIDSSIKNETLEDDESFVTVDACQKEKTTSTDITTIFSPNYTTQSILVARNDYSNRPPPPPYEYAARPQTGPPVYQGTIHQTPVYQAPTSNYDVGPPRDASRAPPYRRSSGASDPQNLFNTKEIRNKFVKKVYAILSVMLLFTFGFITFCIYQEKVRKFLGEQWPVLIGVSVVYFVLVITLLCYQTPRRIFPLNFILLTILTLCMAYISASLSCMYKTHIVLVTMGATAGVCTLVSLLACQTWFDITKYGFIICIASLIVLLYGAVATVIYLVTGSRIVYLIYSCLATLLFCVYLMYDTQQILGGRRIELSPEEYILGALTLYIDIMIIFQDLLLIIGFSQS